MTDRISPRQFEESDGLEDWRVLGDGAGTFFSTESFAASARFVRAIGEVDGVEGHLRPRLVVGAAATYLRD